MSKKALIFDIDGTLWDSRALVAEGYNIQLRREGLSHLQLTADTLTPLFGKVMDDIADALFASIPLPERKALMIRCMETENAHLHSDPCHIGYPKVRETMEVLHRDFRLFIVSNSQCGYPELCMKKLGLTDLIEGHMCFGDTGATKGQTMLRLMEKYGISDAVYVGDTQGDLEACEEAGVPFVYAAYGFGHPARYDWKLNAFEELPALAAENWKE